MSSRPSTHLSPDPLFLCPMELVELVSANLEIDEGKAEKGIGAVLMAARMAIDKEASEHLKHAIPNAERTMGRALLSSGRTGETAAPTGPAGQPARQAARRSTQAP